MGVGFRAEDVCAFKGDVGVVCVGRRRTAGAGDGGDEALALQGRAADLGALRSVSNGGDWEELYRGNRCRRRRLFAEVALSSTSIKNFPGSDRR